MLKEEPGSKVPQFVPLPLGPPPVDPAVPMQGAAWEGVEASNGEAPKSTPVIRRAVLGVMAKQMWFSRIAAAEVLHARSLKHNVTKV